jgi:hypothetical protein
MASKSTKAFIVGSRNTIYSTSRQAPRIRLWYSTKSDDPLANASRWVAPRPNKPVKTPVPPPGWIPPRRMMYKADYPVTRIIIGVVLIGSMAYYMVHSLLIFSVFANMYSSSLTRTPKIPSKPTYPLSPTATASPSAKPA